ncbi:MAG: Mut7-C RNAse domain-containing protein [Syntrophaceae bacterium]
MKFLVDSSLGRLSAWVRILGYDTVYWRGEADRAFLRIAEREGRVVLTRRKDVLDRQHPGMVLFIENDRVEDQIVEVVGKLGLRPEPGRLFTVCLRCNESLQESSPDQVRPLIPDYVFRTQKSFRVCPKCGRVYWSGTHRERALSTLKRILER